MDINEEKLSNLCHSLAKSLLWQRKPFDSLEIERLTQFYFETSMYWAPIDLKGETKNLRLVYGAIEVLSASISGPNTHNPKEWFTESLQMLLFIAEPYSVIKSKEGLEFLDKMEKGIRYMRDEDA